MIIENTHSLRRGKETSTYIESSLAVIKHVIRAHRWGKDHCTAGLQFNKTETDQWRKYDFIGI